MSRLRTIRRAFRQKAGLISDVDIWVAFGNDRMFVADSYLELVWIVFTEFNSDKHLC